MERIAEPQNQYLNEVLEIMNALARKSASANYIFRGETQCFPTVSSRLLREHPSVTDIEGVQRENLEEAKRHTFETDDFTILTELQHYGGDTNLIDFTADYLIALFFACDGDYSQDGRVVLLERKEERNEQIYGPRHPANRVLAQKSIFVRPPQGYVEPDDSITIPQYLKLPTLEFLQKGHGLSSATIYNDLHGYIRSQIIHREANKAFATALDLWSDEDYESSIEWCNKAIDLNPRMPAIYCIRGDTYWSKGRLDLAIEDYNRSIELDSEDALAYFYRGIAYYDKGELSQAIHDYGRAIELDPQYYAAYYRRGDAYLDRNEFDQAVENYTRAIELVSEYAAAFCGRGYAYYGKGEIDLAVEDFSRSIDLLPEYAAAYCGRGGAYSDKGEFDLAIQDYDRAVELDPEYDAAYFGRGSVYSNRGELDLAIENYNRAIELAPHQVLYNSLGIAYHYKGEFNRAIENYNRATELDPNYADPYGNLGEAWIHLSEWAKARVNLTTALEMGIDIVASFRNEYESVADFEQKNGIRCPDDIAEMLGRYEPSV